MAIPTNKSIKAVTYNGASIPLASGGTTIQTASGTLTTFDRAAHTLSGLSFLPDIISFNLPNNYYVQINRGDEISNYLPSAAVDLTRLSTNARSQNNWVHTQFIFANPQDRIVWYNVYLEITINNGVIEYKATLSNDEGDVLQSVSFLPSGSFAWQAWELGLRG